MIDAKTLLDGLIASAAAPAPSGAASPAAASDPSAMLGDLMGKLGMGSTAAGAPGGGLLDIAKQVLGEATSGVKDVAGKAEAATGVGKGMDDVLRQLTGGQGAGDLMATAREMMARNPAAAGALAGVLGGLLLGSQTGRSLGWNAAKLGGLVLIGGLAYKAYQNHKAGKPVLGGEPAAAPAGTGYDAASQSNEAATLYLRTMIAAAAADGVLDAGERQRIIGSVSKVGIDPAAAEFLDREFASPASIETIATAATTPEMKAQAYTAARLAIDPDTAGEKAWLASLAARLGLEPGLVAHLDASADAAKVAA